MKSKNISYKTGRAGISKWLLKVAGSFMIFSTTFSLAHAQDVSEAAGKDSFWSNLNQNEIILLIAMGVLIALTLLIVIVFLYVLSVFRLLLGDKKTETKVAQEEGISFWSRLNKKFGSGDLVPVGQEKKIMMDHAYDGIHELDNHMPPWLKYLFFLTIGFAVVYVLHYLILDTGKLQLEEYQEEIALAEEEAASRTLLAGSSIDENNVALVTDEAALGEAETLFAQNCAACHGADGGGTVGPNLTDEYWLHGGSVQDVFKVIKYGVQEKGMIPWQDKLNPEQIQRLASYILSLQGTTPANPKDPQGEKYEMEASTTAVVGSLE